MFQRLKETIMGSPSTSESMESAKAGEKIEKVQTGEGPLVERAENAPVVQEKIEQRHVEEVCSLLDDSLHFSDHQPGFALSRFNQSLKESG